MISVIIPNYNHGLFLKQRIDSVLNQSYKNFEIILLDDCSTDNSKEIMEFYRDHPRVSAVIYNDYNSGSAFKQWNKGIAKAKGKYIWIAESDDYADPVFLQKMMDVLSSEENCTLAYCDSFEINEKNEKLGRWSRWQCHISKNIWQSNFSLGGNILNSKYNYIANVIPNASGVVFKKSAYENSPVINEIEKLRFTGDWLMWFSIIQNGMVYYCHEPLNYFRYHEGTTRSDSERRLANILEHYQAIWKLGRLIKRNPDPTLRENKLNELYNSWNPGLKKLTSKENSGILKFALLTDRKVIKRILKTLFKKIYILS